MREKNKKEDDLMGEEKVQDPDAINMENLYNNSVLKLEEGQIIKGRIIYKDNKEVMVDIGYKSEGILPMREFLNPDEVKIGDEIEVFLESKEDEKGRVVLSKQKADKLQGWEVVIGKFNEGDMIEGKVTRKVKGGLMVDVGKLEAFLPASLAIVGRGFGNLNRLIGQDLKFRIVKINKPRRNIVLSRKDVLAEEKAKEREKILSTIEKGALAAGVVKNITDFGAFIDLGEGITGLLHITDMSWGRVSHPSEIVAVGDKIEVLILDFDVARARVSLGLKQKTPNPWLDIETKYPIGTKIKGKVVNITTYGAFVELEKGIEGLVHISEFSWTKRYNHPSELLAIGDIVETVVLNVDKDGQKISLGIKQLEQDPWTSVEEKYRPGTKIDGKVRNITDYGAFIELEEGIDGLVHISDISWTKRIEHPKEILKRGQKVEAVILSADAKNRRISLGIKQLSPDPWPDILTRYEKEKDVEGTISKVTNFGIFVDLEEGLEGIVPISEIPKDKGEKLEEVYKVGDKLPAKVVKAEPSQKKISLALKA
ncbi:MAG: 30S ribosomal protein S1 [Candidatus Omnitrophica bacterium CG07_land_8_20_14_0_80_42_15]|uniref:30S ribosomal protein S1 n=1 Tax=Candidatus Aquitaenariimonas noxiae TaxID=1974741 RepID=A0A2J0KXF0_9BACT|nr:MAG: 30S ribosomal protein S1 [Candidatus Omnitrophica bacterium CG07_land_8_20_14_0_80_42_15]